jgi:xylan 1,4-beta-xylosidase
VNGLTSGCGLLKSTNGLVNGTYSLVNVTSPLGNEIDASLFQDTDGTVYYLYHNGMIAKMKADMSGLAETPHLLTIQPDYDSSHHSELCKGNNHIGYEGAYLFKRGDTYYLSGSDHCDGRYSSWVVSSNSLDFSSCERYEAVPYGGHNMYFQDKNGKWWSTIFNGALFQEAAVVPISFDAAGNVVVVPEPGTLALFGVAFVAYIVWNRRKQK